MSEGNFEAKVHARRETRDGVYITLSVNPADMTTDLAMLRVGSALVIGWSEVVDTAVEPIEFTAVEIAKIAGYANADAPKKDKRKFTDLPLSQQAAMRCQEDGFRAYLRCNSKKDVPSVVRALCGVESRSDIIIGTPAGDKWCQLEVGYQSWLTTLKYQDTAR